MVTAEDVHDVLLEGEISAEHPPLRARAAGENAAFELLEADVKAFVSEINLGVDLTWY